MTKASAALFLIAGVSLAAPAHAQAWRPTTLECSHTINNQQHAESGGGLWPSWALCTAERTFGPNIDTIAKGCIDRINAWRVEHRIARAQGDPVADTMKCIEKSIRR